VIEKLPEFKRISSATVKYPEFSLVRSAPA